MKCKGLENPARIPVKVTWFKIHQTAKSSFKLLSHWHEPKTSWALPKGQSAGLWIPLNQGPKASESGRLLLEPPRS